MSQDIFQGRKFTVPIGTAFDEKVASMARAQIASGIASPGAYIQVGDTTMRTDATARDVHMGDLDIRLRTFEQLPAPAQEVVRRNILAQYGDPNAPHK